MPAAPVECPCNRTGRHGNEAHNRNTVDGCGRQKRHVEAEFGRKCIHDIQVVGRRIAAVYIGDHVLDHVKKGDWIGGVLARRDVERCLGGRQIGLSRHDRTGRVRHGFGQARFPVRVGNLCRVLKGDAHVCHEIVIDARGVGDPNGGIDRARKQVVFGERHDRTDRPNCGTGCLIPRKRGHRSFTRSQTVEGRNAVELIRDVEVGVVRKHITHSTRVETVGDH